MLSARHRLAYPQSLGLLVWLGLLCGVATAAIATVGLTRHLTRRDRTAIVRALSSLQSSPPTATALRDARGPRSAIRTLSPPCLHTTISPRGRFGNGGVTIRNGGLSTRCAPIIGPSSAQGPMSASCESKQQSRRPRPRSVMSCSGSGDSRG
jgi:hypothetical protein